MAKPLRSAPVPTVLSPADRIQSAPEAGLHRVERTTFHPLGIPEGFVRVDAVRCPACNRLVGFVERFRRTCLACELAGGTVREDCRAPDRRSDTETNVDDDELAKRIAAAMNARAEVMTRYAFEDGTDAADGT